jgi:hypothetical protein
MSSQPDERGLSAITADDLERIDAFLGDGSTRRPDALIPDGRATRGSAPDIADAECAQARVMAARGASAYDAADALDRSQSAMRRHMRGDCHCEHDLPRMRYAGPAGQQWLWDPQHDEDVPACDCGRNRTGLFTEIASDGTQFHCVKCGRYWVPDPDVDALEAQEVRADA